MCVPHRHEDRAEALSPPMLFHTLDNGPDRVTPFSYAVSVGTWAFITGSIPTDPKDNALPLPAGVEVQTRAVMPNLLLFQRLPKAALGPSSVVWPGPRGDRRPGAQLERLNEATPA
jgi:hypothetical protein